MKLAVPDLISNSYFPAIAAVELGFFKREGLDVSLELIVPIEHALAAMRDGSLEFVGCSAHLLVAGFPEWRDVKLLCAQAQGMYWFLVMRSDLGARRGDLAVLKGRRIGAAHWVAMGLRRLLAEAGIDAERDAVTIAPIPGAHGAGTNFGVSAAQALEEGKVDGVSGPSFSTPAVATDQPDALTTLLPPWRRRTLSSNARRRPPPRRSARSSMRRRRSGTMWLWRSTSAAACIPRAKPRSSWI
jgi:ABC-type nitrate/sulfonate/bicarbonate transport system substrate-binding protein